MKLLFKKLTASETGAGIDKHGDLLVAKHRRRGKSKQVVAAEEIQALIDERDDAMCKVTFKPVFHLANLFARTEKKVGTVPTCSRQIFSPTNVNQSRCRILVFASRRANKVAMWKIGLGSDCSRLFL